MDAQTYLQKMKIIQDILLKYVDDEADDQNIFNEFLNFIKTEKVQENIHLLTSMNNLLASIAAHHHHTLKFFDKIFKIILFFKDDLMKHYTNFEIYNFFNECKRVILFLIEEKIINVDSLIASKIIDKHQDRYFFPEIKQFITKKIFRYRGNVENFEELRKVEYGDTYILQLVQRDSIDDFITYINQTNFKLNNYISSQFETNTSLIFGTYLINYSAFFGSIQIFKYLLMKDQILDSSSWIYAIYGRNREIINILKEKQIEPDSYLDCLKLSIQCHHDEITYYFLDNYFENEDISKIIFQESIKSYNFSFIKPEMINLSTFHDFCTAGHFYLVRSFFQNNKEIDINGTVTLEYIDHHKNGEGTFFYCAVESGNLEIVKFFLENYEIDVNKKAILPEIGWEITPLYKAIKRGYNEIAKCLLDNKSIDVNLKSLLRRSQQTPLYVCIEKNNLEIFKLLIERADIDINLKSMQFEEDLDECTLEFYREVTPLYLAAQLDRCEMAQLLLEKENIDVNNIINIKIDQYNLSTKKRYDTQYEESTALLIAVEKERDKIVQLLLSHEKTDASITKKNTEKNGSRFYSAIEIAVDKENAEIVKLLLDHKNVDVNTKHFTSYGASSNTDIWDKDVIESSKRKTRQLENGAEWSKTYSDCIERAVLHMAIESENVEIVRLLLEYEGTDVNIQPIVKTFTYSYGDNGNEVERRKLKKMTPLYLAVEKNNVQIVQLLAEHKKVDINMKSVFYKWIKESVYQEGFQQAEDDAIITEVDKDETALHNAVSKGNIDIIKILLGNKNIDVNVTDKQGRKPVELTDNDEIKALFNV
ncbi:LON peptidase N-terminal domain and RING finger protein 2 [Tritrichomonas musculus]|uniref:LON peptidase N-terminal domain and RING finger protein 2 n=1 Tax=Tritrichomonas musculus TaxID=1915356 RepID=A0ABR2IBN6_9EUKA